MYILDNSGKLSEYNIQFDSQLSVKISLICKLAITASFWERQNNSVYCKSPEPPPLRKGLAMVWLRETSPTNVQRTFARAKVATWTSIYASNLVP